MAKDVSQSAGTLPKARPGAISLGRATGISRVPDEALCQSPHRVQTSLHSLLKRAACLENSGDTLVSGGVDISTVASASDDIINEWDSILAQYRQLTMAITASASGVMDDLAIPVYEGAADASLLAGNLDYYLSCQTRLLQDLYNSNPTRKNNALRHDEFTAYSLLYFGVFQPNSCEVAHITRGMSKQTFASSFVKLSLSAITAFRDLNGLSFISIYRRSTVRQRTILNPKLDLMMRHGMNALLRTYLELDRSFALKCLGLKADPDFLRLLKSERPDLAEKNPQTGLNFIFRVPVRK